MVDAPAQGPRYLHEFVALRRALGEQEFLIQWSFPALVVHTDGAAIHLQHELFKAPAVGVRNPPDGNHAPDISPTPADHPPAAPV